MNREKRKDIALLIVRLAFGTRLIYGSIDNITDWGRMLEFKGFLDANGFPLPLFCAIVSVYAQFFAGISWIIGYKIRIFALLMILNFTIAIIGAHLLQGDTYINTAPAIHLLAISFLIYFLHAGRYSVDSYLKTKREQSDISLKDV